MRSTSRNAPWRVLRAEFLCLGDPYRDLFLFFFQTWTNDVASSLLSLRLKRFWHAWNLIVSLAQQLDQLVALYLRLLADLSYHRIFGILVVLAMLRVGALFHS